MEVTYRNTLFFYTIPYYYNMYTDILHEEKFNNKIQKSHSFFSIPVKSLKNYEIRLLN